MRLIAAESVPPVAARSSMIMTRSRGSTASTCISKQSCPYSSSYDSDMTFPIITVFSFSVSINNFKKKDKRVK